MVTAAILINQTGKPAGTVSTSRDDLDLGVVVNLSNNNNTGITSWVWEFISKPPGSYATLTSPYSATATFTPDIRGSYLFKLTVSDGINTSVDQRIAAVKTNFLKIRIPALEETSDYSSAQGWADAMHSGFSSIDAYASISLRVDGSNSPTSNIDFNDKRIVNLHEPVSNYDATTKNYVDTVTNGKLSDPMTTRGDVIYRNSSNITDRLPLGDDGYVLSSNGLDLIWSQFSSGTYTNPDPCVVGVGGIEIGTTFTATTFPEFMDMLLYPELFPTLVNPSSTFSMSPSGLREVGEIISSLDFSSAFNRGSITPAYGTSGYRSGLPNQYIYTGTRLVSELSTSLTDSYNMLNYTVVLGTQSWTGRVAYDAGEQPLGSKGSNYNFPLAAGSTSIVTTFINGVYPFFATTVNITTMTKQSLASHGATVTTSMVLESGGNKQSVEFPVAWGTISQLSQYNPLSDLYDVIDLSTFTVTSITKTINGNLINYNKYTHNGSLTGARILRWSV